MAFDESFDERTERQNGEISRADIFEREPDQPIAKAATLDALVDLGVDERDQAWSCPVGRKTHDFAVDRKLVAFTVRYVGYLDALWRSHACQVRARRSLLARRR